MNITMTPSLFPASGSNASRRWLPLSGIVLAHCGLFYALQNGLVTQVAQVLPKEVVMTFVQPAPPARPATPPQAKLTEKTLRPPTPVLTVPAIPPPLVTAAPQPDSITLKASEPVVAVKAEAAVPTVNSTASAPAAPKVVNAVEYLRPPVPEYPSLSRKMGEEGKVVMRVLVNEKGRPEKIDVHQSSGSHRLDEAARIAIMRAIFKPYHEDGKALAVIATATINFSLDS